MNSLKTLLGEQKLFTCINDNKNEKSKIYKIRCYVMTVNHTTYIGQRDRTFHDIKDKLKQSSIEVILIILALN